MTGIYIIGNTINNHVYIGQSTKIERRIAEHKSTLRHNKHQNTHLQASWNMYGEDAFLFDVIVECEEDELDANERKYISIFNSTNQNFGYNHETGGNKKSECLSKRNKKSQKIMQTYLALIIRFMEKVIQKMLCQKYLTVMDIRKENILVQILILLSCLKMKFVK